MRGLFIKVAFVCFRFGELMFCQRSLSSFSAVEKDAMEQQQQLVTRTRMLGTVNYHRGADSGTK